ncbi:MAG: S9 family peptidase [Acidobacteriia bacterium]|nr:S9 family peptidase [Terriglobia bacterium]
MKPFYVAVFSFMLAFQMDAKPKLLDTETFFEMENMNNPAIAPDGGQIVFTRIWVDKIKDQSRANLWIVERDGTRLRELTHGNWRDTDPVWSPDGKRIAFLSDRDGANQIHVMWAETREALQLTHLQQRPEGLTWSPDGRQLAFTMQLPDEKPILDIKLPAKPKGAEWAKPAVLVDRLSWGSDGTGPTLKGYRHIFTVDAITGGTPKQVTEGDFNHSAPAWSLDGKTLFLSGIRKPGAEYLRGDSEIYSVDLATGATKTLTERKGPDQDPLVSPDGKWIAYTGYDHQGFTRHLSNIYLMSSDGSGKRTLAGNLPDSPAGMEWLSDGSGLYYLMNEEGTSNMYVVPLEGNARKVTEGNHVISAISVSRAGYAAAIMTSYHQPGTLVLRDLKRPDGWKSLVDVNSDVLEGRQLGAVEMIRASSKDNLKVQGWLVKPAEFVAGKKYPLLLFIHGGPWSAYTVGFNWSWQNFAAKGYGVLYMNPRGSTGYGQGFVNGIQHSYPGKDFDDLMAGVDAAIAKGWVDERNLFVCGGSGGGVLTAWIVGHTNRFRAAVSMRPVINWHSFVGTTDGSMWYDQFRKFPWEDPAEYAARSPLHYVANVTTPTMVMTGEADLRTPISQSEEYYRALKMLKKETLLVRMPEEFHGWRRPSHQLAQQLYLLAWFEKYRVR